MSDDSIDSSDKLKVDVKSWTEPREVELEQCEGGGDLIVTLALCCQLGVINM